MVNTCDTFIRDSTANKYTKNKKLCLTLNFTTCNEGITREASSTAADWIVVDNLTASIVTACVRTWVYTLLLGACTILWAHGIVDALGATVGWGSNEFGQTRANSMTVVLGHTLAVLTTWGGLACIEELNFFYERNEMG